jgi:cation transporter-like permease
VQLTGAFAAYPASHDWSHVALNGSVAVHVPALPLTGGALALMHGSRLHAGYSARSRGPQPSLIARFNASEQLGQGLAALPTVAPNTAFISLTLATFHPDTSCEKANVPL